MDSSDGAPATAIAREERARPGKPASHPAWAYACGGISAGVFALIMARHAIDFRVYYATATAFRLHGGPVYGPKSGTGFPMIFLYPPLALAFFYPLALLPFRAAVAVWGALNGLALTGVIRAWRQRFISPAASPRARLIRVLVPLVLFGPYLVQELRGGNAQLLVLVLVCWALLLLDTAPLAAALLLALATYLKVWPLFFGPLLLAQRRWKAAAAGALGLLLLLPATSLFFGWTRTLTLSHQWFQQIFVLNSSGREIWYPSQSLHGMLTRYLTRVDYSALPDSNYREVNLLHLHPAAVEHLWFALAILMYSALFAWIAWLPRKAGRRDPGREDATLPLQMLTWAVPFCLLLLIEPNVHRTMLVDLLWPALAAAELLVAERTRKPARVLLWTAAVAALVEPLIPGAASQRLMQVLGVDFAIVVLVTIGLGLAAGDALGGEISRPSGAARPLRG